MIFRVGGAIILAFLGAGCSLFEGPTVCAVCSRPLHGETFYRIHLENGVQRDVCCPRCGLHFQAGRDDVVNAEVADFHSGRLLDARRAYYVESSAAMLCCRADKLERDRSGSQYSLQWDRCMPSLVAFESIDDAREFSRSAGGVVKTYDQLLVEPEFAARNQRR